ncbi:hypothetical protein Tco_1008263 [Tanacetum coccineum]
MDEDIQELETEETQSHPSTEVAKDNWEKHEEVVASYVNLKWGLETFNKASGGSLTFDFSGLKSLVESLKAIIDAQNDHLATWAKSSSNLAWSVGQTPPSSSVPTTTLALTEGPTTIRGRILLILPLKNLILTLRGEKADMETKEAV